MLDSKLRVIMLLGLHALMAYLSIQSSQFCMAWGVIVILVGLYQIIKNGNADNEAAFYAAYWVGLEILLRMNHGSLTYESGKYGVIVLLITGIYAEKRPFYLPRHFLVFFLLLLPSLTVIDFPSFDRGRKEILFNLSGPLSLIASGIYFYKREFTREQFNKLLIYFVLPIFAVAVVLFFKTPKLEDVTFTLNSNVKMSGGFGANQVSTVLGLGVFIIAISMFMGFKISGNKLIDIAIFSLLAVRGLLTFSRGGILASAIAILVALFIFAINAKDTQLVKRIIVTCFFVGVAGFFVFDYTDSKTGGFLKKRYANESTTPGKKRDFTTGRLKILMAELEAFSDYPVLGAGIGMGKRVRKKDGKKQFASHTEFSRLLSEHGFYGLIALLILLISPLVYYLQANSISKPLIAAFTILCFLTMTHGAMRLATPGFLYGLIFIYLLPTSTDDSLHREQT